MIKKYSLSIRFKNDYYNDKKFMEKIFKCVRDYNSTGSIIRWKGDDPKLHCIVEDLNMLDTIFDMFMGYNIKLEIYKLEIKAD